MVLIGGICMYPVQIKLTVLFDGMFWIGIFERVTDQQLEVAKFVFGAEPKETELYEWIGRYYFQLKFSPTVSYQNKIERSLNPKRAKRIAKKQMLQSIGTKSQQVLCLQREQQQKIQKRESKRKYEADKDWKLAKKRSKRLEKHKGR